MERHGNHTIKLGDPKQTPRGSFRALNSVNRGAGCACIAIEQTWRGVALETLCATLLHKG
jgi:hypothetical protein